MVGLFDEQRSSEKIRKVGSGFIIDSEQGLIVTAAHTLMQLWGQENFGVDNDGIEGAKAVIGVIPSEKNADGSYPPAVFRYFAKILKKDTNLENGECHVDACVLQITSRFENDVDGNGDFCGEEISTSLTGEPVLMKEQNLAKLDVTEESHLGESIRILGFDQPDNTRVNRSFGVSAGTVYKQFETKAVGGERYRYMPRKKTVLICNTIGGHSGGPCVNQSGQVIGILSCAGFTERSRSYLVPTSEWIHLVPKNASATNDDKEDTAATTTTTTGGSSSTISGRVIPQLPAMVPPLPQDVMAGVAGAQGDSVDILPQYAIDPQALLDGHKKPPAKKKSSESAGACSAKSDSTL